jgi:hypothetical protein
MDDRVWYWIFKPTSRLWLHKHVLVGAETCSYNWDFSN